MSRQEGARAFHEVCETGADATRRLQKKPGRSVPPQLQAAAQCE
jgi:hypothetical protein